MALSPLIAPRDLKDLDRFTLELNRHLSTIVTDVGTLRGDSGRTPTIAVAPDFSLQRLTRVGRPLHDDDAVTLRYLREASVVANADGDLETSTPIIARGGIRTPRPATHPDDLVTLGQLPGAVGGIASPLDATYLVITNTAALPNERALAVTGGHLTLADGGAGASVTLGLPAVGPGATGPIGDGTHVAAVTIDTQGRVTALSSVLITGAAPSGAAGGDLSGTYPNPSVVDDSHAHTSATVTPVGIGAQPVDADLTELAAVANVRGDILVTNAVPSWVRLAIGGAATYLRSDGTDPSWSAIAQADVTNLVTDLAAKQPLDADLTALAALAATAGMLSRTGAGAFTARTLTAPAAGLTIADPTGAAGNPTWALANDLAALEGLGSTGIACRTAADTWAQRTVTGGTGVTITNPSGVAGNIDVALSLGAIDHNSLLNLATGDVHTHYLLLAGRAGTTNNPILSLAGDGTIYGSGTTAKNLVLRANDDDLTTGTLNLDAPQTLLWPSVPSGSAPAGAMAFTAALTIASPSYQILKSSHTDAISGFPTYSCVVDNSTFNMNAGSVGMSFILFNATPTLNAVVVGASSALCTILNAAPTISIANFTQTQASENPMVLANPTCLVTGASAVGTWTAMTGFKSSGTLTVNTAGAVGTVTNWRHFRAVDVAKGGTGTTKTVTTQTGVYIPDLTAGATNLSLHSEGAAVDMRHAGGIHIGSSTATPDTSLHITGTASKVGALTFDEETSNPTGPSAANQARAYMKADKFVIQCYNAGAAAVRYFWLDLTATANQSWIYSTAAP